LTTSNIVSRGDLAFPGSICHLKESDTFDTFRKQFYEKKWVVYCKPPFGGPEGVLKYLGRYTTGSPSAINRILNIQDGKVFFRWRDYADDNVKRP